MRIVIVCPARPGTRHGNRVTALRWSRILRALGHRAVILTTWTGEPADLLIALHARKSASSVERFHAAHPGRPVVVALTGTDLYRDLRRSPRARRALSRATRVVCLQPLALRELSPAVQRRAHVIHQSVRPVPRRTPRLGEIEACVLGHLRPEKDPFRAALAARLLPVASGVRVTHVGSALTASMARRARAEERRNPRYRWLGELPRSRALAVLGRSRLLVHPSRLEGGANAVSEALASGIPILASRIPGNVGLLGPGHPGLFPAGDTAALTRLLRRTELDSRFLARLKTASRRRSKLFSPAREKTAWTHLLREISWKSTANGR